jgi:hypothetical protein
MVVLSGTAEKSFTFTKQMNVNFENVTIHISYEVESLADEYYWKIKNGGKEGTYISDSGTEYTSYSKDIWVDIPYDGSTITEDLEFELVSTQTIVNISGNSITPHAFDDWEIVSVSGYAIIPE